jgi:predicted dienelactone hydrolase
MTIKNRSLFAGFGVLMLFAAVTAIQADDRPGTAKPAEIATTEAVWHDDTRQRDVPVKIYYPKILDGKLPVVIFSHGLGGSREGYSYLGKYWAARGYVVVHLTHKGSDTEALLADGRDAMQQTMRKIVAEPMNAVDRYADVSFAIDRLTELNDDSESVLHDKLDLDKIAVAGHSFGGNTTMVIAGQMVGRGKSFADKRVKCVIAMSAPPARQADLDAAYASITMPVFSLTGTEDNSPIGETKAADRRVGFDHLAHAPAFLLTFDGGDHMLFSGRAGPARPATDERYHQLIQEGTTAFLDAYLKGDDDAKKWFADGGYEKAVGDAGKFEAKGLN